MAVVSVKALPRRPAARNEKTRTYTREFRVIVNSATDTSVTARDATGIPRVRDVCPFDSSAWCRNVEADHENGNLLVYLVTAYYESPEPTPNQQNQDGIPQDPNPLLRPAIINGGFRPIEEPLQWATYFGKRILYEDGHFDDSGLLTNGIDDKPVINSALQKFIPAPTSPVNYPIASITRNLPTWGLKKAAERMKRINTDNWMFMGEIIPKYTALIDNITWTRQAETYDIPGTDPPQSTTIIYWVVTHEIAMREQGWQLDIQDRGVCYKVNAPDAPAFPGVPPIPNPGPFWVIKPMIDPESGERFQDQRNLDGNGSPLVRTNNPNPAQNIDSVYLRFMPYEGASFTAMGLA